MSGTGVKPRTQTTLSSKGRMTITRPSQSIEAETQPREKRRTRAAGSTEVEGNDQEIGDAVKGMSYLEETLLFVPEGALPTLDALSSTLFQIAAMQGIGRPAVNAIRAVAYVLKEVELGEVAKAVRNIADTQFSEMANDLKEYTEGLKESMAEEMGKRTEALEKKTGELVEAMEKAAQQAGNTGNSPYRDALTRSASGAPPDTNPRLAAKESIRQRQSLIDLPKGSTLRNCANTVLVGKLSEAMGKVTDQKHKIRSALKLQNGGILVEMVTDDGAAWLASKANAEAFLRELGESEASFKTRSYNVIAYYVPLSLDPSSESHRKEIEEANGIPTGVLTKIRWIKPPMRRQPDQRFAHIIITFSDAESANRAIVNGLSICHKRVPVAKCRKEPIRCLKCQGWDHIAAECVAPKEVNICGTCGARDHWTSNCKQQGVAYCTSCRTNDHASWDRECPTFLRKVDELNARDPANDIPFFPARETWTWSQSYPSQGRRVPPAQIQVNYAKAGSQKSRYKQTQLNFDPAVPGGRPYTREQRARQPSKPPAAKSPPPNFPNPESRIAPPATSIGSPPPDSSHPIDVAHV
ncbi:hypothetical protein K443DRAFT_112668 [Laccaria amethystina LaAM-08-1]|uniref:CCHC-type domain-containing protein n=1 Tax=Laccaria amethystina LaAM-08-1 TaxID=1095629 RepID=A0A0C9WIJ4_9AGAR|nr:hypothetical protein K443DRAFT_112668 [Laccaria amethystina LaAM-08-1]